MRFPRETLSMWDSFQAIGPYLLAAVNAVVALIAAAHAVMYKRDTRAAIAWVGLIWLTPLIGAFLYVTLGINRIRRRGQALGLSESRAIYAATEPATAVQSLLDHVGYHPNVAALASLVGQLTRRPLLPGNRITPLENGEQAYPSMLEAIRGATRSITLCTYIFDTGRVGGEFLKSLADATRRGVEVRVLLDDVGARYSRPRIVSLLRTAGINTQTFLPTRIPRVFHYANLRNHRKILVVDGTTGFTGGMNLRDGHRLDLGTRHPIQDVHFRVEGPVVGHLQEVFAADWQYSCGENLTGERWFPPITPQGIVGARGISDGPDEDFEKLRLAMLGALSCATSSVYVTTPYFLPDMALLTAFNVAAMRGVKVNILLPERNNIKLVEWASTALLWQLLERGCRIWATAPPFDHAKLMVVDGLWSLLGSSNWDPRSLRLNFEFNLECYDRELASWLIRLVESKIARAREVTFADVEARSIPVRLRDGTARLFSPYL